MSVLAAFALKMLIVVAVARLIRRRCPDGLGAVLAAWVIVTAVLVALLLLLSAGALATGGAIWTALVIGASCAAVALRRGLAVPQFAREGGFVPVPFALFFAAFALRALLFQDFTWDAQTYGLVRIGLWMNYGTLLVDMPTPQVNVFTNEWNGELIGLFYGLAAGDLQGPIFANAEVLLVTYLACAWLARRLGASWAWAFAGAGLVALCPAMLGIATTVKGDLLAVGAFVSAVGWLLTFKEQRGGFALAMVVACLALAVGAKVTAAIGAIAVGMLALMTPWRGASSLRSSLLLGGGLAALFLSRLAANVIQYGDPLHRVGGEALEPGLGTLLANIALIIRRAVEFAAPGPSGGIYSWQLSGGLGVSGFALILPICALLFFRKRGPRLLSSILALALLSSAFVVPARTWSFRYFLPIMVSLGVIVVSWSEPRRQKLWIVGMLLLTATNVSYLFRDGELNGGGSFSRAVREQLERTPIERTFLPWESRRDLSLFDRLRLEQRSDPLVFVILHQTDCAIAQFLGSRAQHRIILTGSLTDLTRSVRSRRPDLAVVTTHTREEFAAKNRDEVTQAGYVWIADNDIYAVAARADRLEALLACSKRIAPN